VNLLGVVGPLLASRQRREVMLALTAAYMLVQLSSLPVALALPSLAEYFDTGIGDAAWIVIIYLLMLGSMVLLAARLGDRYGHARVFFLGILASTIGSGLIAFSQELWQIVVWRAVAGLGSAMVMGNANAILAATFPAEERGRAFAIPIIGSRFGTLAGLAGFGLFLQFFSWRLIFLSFVPLGLLAAVAAIPMLKHGAQPRSEGDSGPIDWIGAVLLVSTAVVLILSSSHLHGGEESFVTSDGLQYHLPMHGLFLGLLVAFILVELRIKNPVVDMRHFRRLPFSMSLGANVTYHFSMLATMTLIPILVEDGFGKSPLWVTVVLLPSQTLGLVMPMVAGWIFDRYQASWLRPVTMVSIAGGFLLLGLSAPHVAIWGLPLLMLPISIGTNMFNPINNATIMNSLPLEHRGVASGLLETTRELGHALGATAAAGALALTLPATIGLLSDEAARGYFVDGFKVASLMVVFTLMFGAILAYFYKAPRRESGSEVAASKPSLQAGSDD
jgi:MFS family permease